MSAISRKPCCATACTPGMTTRNTAILAESCSVHARSRRPAGRRSHLALRRRMGHHRAGLPAADTTLAAGAGYQPCSDDKIEKNAEETHEQAIRPQPIRYLLWLGRRRRRRADDLRRLWYDALARRIPAADFGRDGLVAQRR